MISTAEATLRISRSTAFRLERAGQALRTREAALELGRVGLPAATRISTHMTARELRQLWELGSSVRSGGTVLEIGSYLGASSCYLAAAVMPQGGRLICVDTWQNETMADGHRDTFAAFTANTAPVRDRITAIRKRSDQLTYEELPAEVDLLFLDGDHSYAAVNGDFHRLYPLVRPGGVLAFHDAVEFQGVARTVGEAMASGELKLGGHVDNLVFLRKTPPLKQG